MAGQKIENIFDHAFNSETVCARLLQKNGIDADAITIRRQGTFRKSYRQDIESFEVEEYKNRYKFDITINRNGIYDLLPEGLFHQTLGSARVKNTQDAVEEHKRYKEEEKAARNFFAPLEQMLFRYKVYSEVAENKALFDFQNGKLNPSFYDFWGIGQDILKEEANRLLVLMPYLNFTKGNTSATTAALGYILQKEVHLERQERPDSFGLPGPKTDDYRLGINTVLGDQVNDLLQFWVFRIKHINKEDLENYVPGRPTGKLLQKFVEIFIPLEVEVNFEFETDEINEEEGAENILGYASYL